MRKLRFNPTVVAVIVIGLIIVATLVLVFKSESFSRKITDMKSNLGGGLERTITVYTADGKELAHYEGNIDIENNSGGTIKFDYNGKRYIYYNCFVETIADID